MKIETWTKILIAILVLNLIVSGMNFFKSDDNGDLMTKREHELILKLHDADIEIDKYESMDSVSTAKIEMYESLIDTTIIRNSDRAYRDSIRAILNPR